MTQRNTQVAHSPRLAFLGLLIQQSHLRFIHHHMPSESVSLL